jgi:hypothetical protein
MKSVTLDQLGCSAVTDAEAGVATVATDTQIADPSTDESSESSGAPPDAPAGGAEAAPDEPTSGILPPRLRLVSLTF